MFIPLIVIVLIIVLCSSGGSESYSTQEFYSELDYFECVSTTKPEGFEQTAHDKFMSDCYRREL